MRAAVLGATGTIGAHSYPSSRSRARGRRDLAERVDIRRRTESRRVRSTSPIATRSRARSRAVDVVYHLVHSLGAADFEERDRRAADAVAAASAAAGVRQIIYLGGLGDDSRDRSRAHLRSRAETAERLERGPVPVTTLRAAMIVGAGQCGVRDDRRARRAAARDDLPALGLRLDAATGARGRRALPRATSPVSSRRTACASTSAGPR